MRIGFWQFAPGHRSPERNLDRVCSTLSRARADLLVLPELALSGYLFPNRAELAGYAEAIPGGPSVSTLSRLCRDRKVNLVLGLAEAAPGLVFNSAVLIAADGAVHTYRKAHLFLDEKDIFDPGDSPFPVFDVGGVKVGLLICFDYFFPEAARTLALKGAQIICHPSNLVLEYAQSMTLTRAAENRVFWVLCNRTGTETLGTREMTFTGQSQIAAPDGSLLCRAGRDTEELVVVEIDPALALQKNVTPRNSVIADRRTDLYES